MYQALPGAVALVHGACRRVGKRGLNNKMSILYGILEGFEEK